MKKLTLQKEEVEAVEWFDLEVVYEACLTRNPRFCVPIEGLRTLMKYLLFEANAGGNNSATAKLHPDLLISYQQKRLF